jgi:hypothetical protein
MIKEAAGLSDQKIQKAKAYAAAAIAIANTVAQIKKVERAALIELLELPKPLAIGSIQ